MSGPVIVPPDSGIAMETGPTPPGRTTKARSVPDSGPGRSPAQPKNAKSSVLLNGKRRTPGVSSMPR